MITEFVLYASIKYELELELEHEYVSGWISIHLYAFFFFRVFALASANSSVHTFRGYFFVVKQSFDIVLITFCFHQKFCMQNDSFGGINESVIAFEIRFIFNSLIRQKWYLNAKTDTNSARAKNHINYAILFSSLAIKLMWCSLAFYWSFDEFICTFNYTPKHSKVKWEM